MAKKKIEVRGLTIRIEQINEGDYISLTDIAKQSEKSRPGILISSWMKNSSTLEYLEAWERMHNPNFKSNHLDAFKIEAMKNRTIIRPQKSRQNLEWHLSKITDNIDEVRNLLDTIPGQLPKHNRIKDLEGEK